MQSIQSVSKSIKEHANVLSQNVLYTYFDKKGIPLDTVDTSIKEKFIIDMNYHISFLATALALENSKIFINYMQWLAELMYHIGITKEAMVDSFLATISVMQSEFGRDEAAIIESYIQVGIDAFVENYVKVDIANTYPQKLEHPEVSEFLSFLLALQSEKAAAYIIKRIENGTAIKDVYINILQPTLYEIGHMWQKQKISVAKEHYMTAVIQNIIGRLYPYLFNEKKEKDNMMIAVSAGKEMHEIGMRMVADFFEMDGWNTIYLGSNLPIESIISECRVNKPNLLAISATTAMNIEEVAQIISLIRQDSLLKDLIVLVGGRAFNHVPELWRSFGADGFGENAYMAIAEANRLMEEQYGKTK